MNIKQAKEKLDSISKSTGTKHPKTLIAELCVIIKFLLDEVDQVKTPTFTTLTSSPSPEPLPKGRPSPFSPPVQRPIPPENFPLPPTPPYELPYDPELLKHRRKGNAGDAE